MKTVCAWDNVACIVENMATSIDGALVGGAIIGLAFVVAYVFASIMRWLVR